MTADRTPASAALGLDGEPCRARSDNCPHFMFSRCPGCQREMYAPAVWEFSHGEVECQCGTSVVPTTPPPCRRCGKPRRDHDYGEFCR